MKKRVFALALTLVLALSLIPGTAFAATVVDSGYCGGEGDGTNLTWTLDSDGLLTISGTGKMKDYDEYFTGNISAQSPFGGSRTIKTVTIGNNVTSIGDGAFYYCERLTGITIPNSVTSIGRESFKNCWNLTSITIPNSVTSIGKRAFFNCMNLTSITLPSSITSIEEEAFSRCRSLKSISIPDGVTFIGSSAFSGCSSLKNINIPDSVTCFGGECSECSSLESISFPDGVTSIGIGGFWRCYNLKSISIPDSVTSITTQAFYDCISLTSISLPAGIVSIGTSAFTGCENLTDVYYSGTEAQWKEIEIGPDNKSLSNGTITIHFQESPTFIVTFHANGGSVSPAGKTVTKGGTYGTLPTPTRDEYRFDGWFTSASGGTQVTADTTVNLTKSQMLYAHWTNTPISYAVTFNANGGTVSATDKTVANGGTYGTLPTPTRDGYRFDGWFTSASGGTKITPDTTVSLTADQTIYAHWTALEDPSDAGDETDSFTDVSVTAWYYSSVQKAYSMGLLNGKSATSFAPDNNMTYAEAIKLAACMNQLYHNGEVTLENGADQWYDSYVEYALQNGIITKDYASVINKSIDRMTYVSIFFHALPEEAFAEKNVIPDNAIPDVKTGDPCSSEIYTFYRAGILNGNDAKGTFQPTSKIKRCEVAAILIRMMDSSTRVTGLLT